MRFKKKTVKLSSVDTSDSTYRITTETCIDDLVDSIKNVGLMNSPLLIEKSCSQQAEFTIICGFRRVAACRSLGWSDIEARILDTNTKNLECVKLAITDNALQRPLNLIEKSRSFYMLSGFFKDNISMSKAVSALGLPKNPSIIKKIESICHLPLPIQNCILSNTISLAMAVELGMFKQDVSVAFANLFDDLKLSLNKQRELITLVKEIALREDISIMEVLQESDFQKILNKDDFDRTQKTKEIRRYLKKRRFPAITRAEKEFEKDVKHLKLGSGLKLIPPDNFEGTTYMLKLYFNNLKELGCRATSLEKIIQNPAIKKILDSSSATKAQRHKENI